MVDRDRYLAEIADHLPNGFFYQLRAAGAEREFLFCSSGVSRVFGVTAEDAKRDAGLIYGRIRPEFADRVAEAEARSIASGEPFFLEMPIRGPQGRGWVQVSSAKRTRSDGLEVWEGVVLDITQVKAAEAERAEAEHRLELATAAAGIGIWDWNVATGEFYYSPRARAMYGFTPSEEITYEILRQRTHPEDYAFIEPMLQAALDPEVRARQAYRYRITRADTGEQRWLHAYGEATFARERGGASQAVSYTGTLQDVTDEVTIEQAHEEDRARLQLALDAGRLAVWELDVASGAVTPSAELNELYRFQRDARPTVEDFRNCYAPGEWERVQAESAARFEKGETGLEFEAKHVWPDGFVKWIAVRARIFKDQTGKPERVLGVASDVTDRRRQEEQLLITAQELQHRIKNTLSVVQTLAAQTLRSGKPADQAIADLNGRLQALAHSHDLAARPSSSGATVSELVGEITKPYRNAERSQILSQGPEVHLSSRDAVSLGMALHELCTNAVKYGALSSEDGQVSIHWSLAEGQLELVWEESGGPKVKVPKNGGFGTRLLTRGLLQRPHGEVSIDYRPEGVLCRIRVVSPLFASHAEVTNRRSRVTE